MDRFNTIPYTQSQPALLWQNAYEKLLLQPWGEYSLRVRATHNPEIPDLPNALLPPQLNP